MTEIHLFITLISLLFLVGCTTAVAPEPLAENVTFRSNALAENTGVLISFQHPRTWETGYFSDSGASGWLLSNVDPFEAFWYEQATGQESLLMIMPTDQPPTLPESGERVMVETEDKRSEFVLDNGEIAGYIIHDGVAFQLFGFYPVDQEAAFQPVLETVLSTFATEPLGDMDLTNVWLLGSREEGAVDVGGTVEGYAPLTSSSEWLFRGREGQEIGLTVDTLEPDVSLVVDVVDGNCRSLLPQGSQLFTESVTLDVITIPTAGDYRVQITGSTGFIKLGP